jgi:hypothetical protein
VAGILGIMLVVSFPALVRVVRERLEIAPVASSTSARSAMTLKEINLLAPVGRACHSNAANIKHKALLDNCPDFLSSLAGAVLFLPFGLSTLRFRRRNLAVLQLGASHCNVITLKQSIEAVKVKIKDCLRFYFRSGSGRISK